MMATFEQLSYGATPNKVAISSSNGRWVAMQIAIRVGLPLPIELISFNVVAICPTSVMLNWATSSEVNNDYYCLERSIDGTTWECFEQINGQGHSFDIHYYSIMDNHPFPGTSYYRLKQIDFDGKFTYSEIRTTNFNTCNIPVLHIYPNPVYDQLNLSGSEIELFEIRIYNTLGKLVYLQINPDKLKNATLSIDLSFMPVGDYFIQTKTLCNKVVKL